MHGAANHAAPHGFRARQPECDIIKTHQQINDGCFACACRADDGNCLARIGAYRKRFENGLFGRITEVDVFHLHPSLCIGQRERTRDIRDFGLLIDNTENAFRCGECRLEFIKNVGKFIDRAGEFARILYELRHAAERNEEQ